MKLAWLQITDENKLRIYRKARLLTIVLVFLTFYFKLYKYNRFLDSARRKFPDQMDELLSFYSPSGILDFFNLIGADLAYIGATFFVFYGLLHWQAAWRKRIAKTFLLFFGLLLIMLIISDSQVYKKFGVSLSFDLVSFFFAFPTELLQSNSTNESFKHMLRVYRYVFTTGLSLLIFSYILLSRESGIERYINRLGEKIPKLRRNGQPVYYLFLIALIPIILLVTFRNPSRNIDKLERNFLQNFIWEAYDYYFSPPPEATLTNFEPQSLFGSETGLATLNANTNIYVLLLESTSAKYFDEKYRKQVFPFLSNLEDSDSSIRVDQFMSLVPRSSKARSSMVTGTYMDPDGYFSLADRYKYPTLPRLLKQHANAASYYLHTCDLIFDRQRSYFTKLGFDVWDGVWFQERLPKEKQFKVGWGFDDKHMVSIGIDELMKANRKKFGAPIDRPIFAVFSFIGPHHPYDVPRSFLKSSSKRIKGKSNHKRYLRSLAYQDKVSKDIYNKLSELGELDNSLILVLADHGESFGEHGYYIHNFSVYQEEISVPFFMVHPSFKNSKVKDINFGSLLDILPTVSDMMDLPLPQGTTFHGATLFDQKERDTFLNSWTKPVLYGHVRGFRKRLYNANGDKLYEYDLKTDPEEKNPKILDSDKNRSFIEMLINTRREIKRYHKQANNGS